MFNQQRTKTQNIKFAVYTSDTPVALKQSAGHQTLHENVDPRKVTIMQSLEDLALMVSEKKQKLKVFFFKWGNMSVISFEYVQIVKKGNTFMIYSILRNFNLIRSEHKTFS